MGPGVQENFPSYFCPIGSLPKLLYIQFGASLTRSRNVAQLSFLAVTFVQLNSYSRQDALCMHFYANNELLMVAFK